MKARDENGRELDAEFHVERTETGFDVILASRGGSGSSARNTEYTPALRLLLRRMADHKLILDDAQIAMPPTTALPPEQKRLHLRGHGTLFV